MANEHIETKTVMGLSYSNGICETTGGNVAEQNGYPGGSRSSHVGQQRTDEREKRCPSPLKVSKVQQAILLCCAIFVNMTSTGFLYGLGVVYVDVIQTLHVSSTEAAMIQSVTRGVMHGAGILYGALINRFGAANCIIVGSLLAFIGFVGSSFSNDIGVVILVFALFTGSGAGLNWLGALGVVAPAFGSNSGIAISFVNIGSGLAQIYSPYLFEVIIQIYGWRGTFLLYGALFLHNIAAALIVKTVSPRFEQKHISVKDSCKVDVFQNISFALFQPCMFLFGISVLVESWFLVDAAIEKGYSREEGSIFLVIMGVSGMLGRFLVWPMHTKLRFGVINNLAIVVTILGLFHVLFGVFRGYWELLGSSTAFGLFNGMYSGFIAMVPSELLGVERFAFGQGVLSTGNGIFNAIGGPIGGAIKDLTGSYDYVFFFAALCAGIIVLILIMITVIKKIKQERSEINTSTQQTINVK